VSGGHRLEGRAKVTGALPFVDDLRADAVGSGFLVAVPVTSRVATGTVEGIGTTAALAVPGVRLVLTHETAPRLRKVLSVSMAEVGELLPLQDNQIHYYGQVRSTGRRGKPAGGAGGGAAGGGSGAARARTDRRTRERGGPPRSCPPRRDRTGPIVKGRCFARPRRDPPTVSTPPSAARPTTQRHRALGVIARWDPDWRRDHPRGRPVAPH
jgi:xanthine dehydrogenase YagR molybdenum-binding subunit